MRNTDRSPRWFSWTFSWLCVLYHGDQWYRAVLLIGCGLSKSHPGVLLKWILLSFILNPTSQILWGQDPGICIIHKLPKGFPAPLIVWEPLMYLLLEWVHDTLSLYWGVIITFLWLFKVNVTSFWSWFSCDSVLP